jgi:hypothetical protein
MHYESARQGGGGCNTGVAFDCPRDRNGRPGVGVPSLSQDIPGENNKTLEQMAREDYLVCSIYHTHSVRPLKRRVLIR